jgi:hypothetical protein
MDRLNSITRKPNRANSPEVEITRKKSKKAGRQPDWPPNTDTKKVCGTIPLETYEAMQKAIATTHKELKTQNKFINEAILAFLKDEK